MNSAKSLYGSRRGELAFVIGNGPSLDHCKNKLAIPKPYSYRIAINKAIEQVPAEFWFWIDGDAYLKSKDHPNAKAATRIGVEKFEALYDDEVYVWERALGCPSPCFQKHAHVNLNDELKAGKLVHRATSLIGAISLAARLGSARIVTAGCDNHVMPHELNARHLEDPNKDWKSVYTFTFARINEALRNRDKWLPKEIMLRDASRIGISPGELPLQKTTIGAELEMNHDFHKWLEEQHKAKANE